jgi:protein arginine kinase activator
MFFYVNRTPREDKTCPQCGLSTTELFNKGKIGCSACPETFHKELEIIITHIQGRNKFSGRLPQALAEKNQFNMEETKEKLRLAIEEERYEDAALYRDLIRSREGV